MLGDVLVFLRKHLNEHLHETLGNGEPTKDKVVFVDGDKMDPIVFPQGAVTELLINVEEERLLRKADPYLRTAEDGTLQRVNPDLRLVLYILFVARFKQYEAAWEHLSKIIEHLQSTRVFERESHPDLPPSTERLTMELMTLGFAEQNEVWNALRTTHLPSILYRVNLVVMRDQAPRAADRLSGPPNVDIRKIS